MIPAQKLLRNSHNNSCDHTSNYALQEIDESFVPEAGKFPWIYWICALDKGIYSNKQSQKVSGQQAWKSGLVLNGDIWNAANVPLFLALDIKKTPSDTKYSNAELC